MIIDVTGTILTPGNHGKDCLGNGEHEGEICCCDECDFMLCCFPEYAKNPTSCEECKHLECPRKSL